MKISSSGLKAFKVSSMSFVLGVAISACAQPNRSGADNWKEEVLLHDGQKIIVERSQTYGGRSEIGQSLPVKEHTISFRLPGSNNSISWSSEYGDELGRTNFKLAALHILKDTPYIVAVPNLCLAYNKWGRPNPPYVIFRYDRKEWSRIPLNELPSEFKEINLIVNNEGEVEILKTRSLVDAGAVKRLNRELSQPEYRSILREPTPTNGSSLSSCEVLVRYKCGWGAPGEFNRKYFDSICK